MKRGKYSRRRVLLSWETVEPEFQSYLITRRRRPSTARTYASHARVFAEWCNDRETDYITAEQHVISAHLMDIMGKLAHNTVALRLICLRAFYEFCVSKAWRVANPCKGLSIPWEDPDPRKPLTREQVAALLAACRSDRDRDMVTLGLDCGLRVSEVVGLKDENIDFERGVIYVRGKGGKIGWAMPSLAVMGRLRLYTGRKGGVLWWTKDGTPVSIKRAQRNMEEISKRAGVHIHWHQLRTTFANEVLEAGMPLEDLQVLMRHKNRSTTQHYAGHAIHERAMESMRQLNQRRRMHHAEEPSP